MEDPESAATRESPECLREALADLSLESKKGFSFYRSRGSAREVSFSEALARAKARGAWLVARGVRPGDRVLLSLVDEEEMVSSFLGAILAGMIPVLVSPPTSMRSRERYRQRIAHVASTARATAILASRDFSTELETVYESCPDLRAILVVEEAAGRDDPELPALPPAAPQDPCFLQFTSGSTALPKGVIVTHRNILTNAGACVTGFFGELGSAPQAVSWLPLYHDFGLIGFLLAPLLCRGPVAYFSPSLFARRPMMWLRLIHERRATVTGAPPFALSYMMRRLRDHDLTQYDLSCLRVLVCGAEPINPATLTDFAEWLEPAGLDPSCFAPCYGMAESTLATTLHRARTPLHIDRVVAASLRSGVAEAAPSAQSPAIPMLSCGRPLAGHDLRIVSERGEQLGDRRVGEIQICGPSVTPGYYGVQASSNDGWLATGDLGYTVDGELFVCGRSKELMIVRGKNIYPHDIEWTVSSLPALSGRGVAAFGTEGADGEQVIVVIEVKAMEAAVASELRTAVLDAVTSEHGVAPQEILLVVPGTIPKTSSGKTQRRQLRASFEAGRLEASAVEPSEGQKE